MQLTIHNLGKIRDADITIDGITVIAARNDTGKSTIGKAAFALLNSFENFAEKIRIDMQDSIVRTIRRALPRASWASWDACTIIARGLVQVSSQIQDESDLIHNINIICDHYSESLLEGDALSDNIIPNDDIADKLFPSTSEDVEEPEEDTETLTARAVITMTSWLLSSTENAQQCRQAILRLITIDVRTKGATLTERTFRTVFDDQIASRIPDVKDKTFIRLAEQRQACGEQDREATFQGDSCISISNASDELRKVLIVDDPNIIESFDYRRSRYYRMSFRRNITQQDYRSYSASYRQELISAAWSALRHEAENPAENLSESILATEDMQQIIELLQESFIGQSKLGTHGMVMIREQLSEPINMANASMGSKAMLLLRFLVEHLVVHESDILVLDEPEIHLHPEWQITYAHALVLIAKRMGIRVIVTTHSPFFLKALAGYSGIEDYSDQLRYYTADANEDGSNSFREVTDSGIGELYASMSRPLREIDRAVFKEMLHND